MAEAAFSVRFQQDVLTFNNKTQLTANLFAASTGHRLVITFPNSKNIILTLSPESVPLVGNDYLTADLNVEYPEANVEFSISEIGEYIASHPSVQTYPLKDSTGENTSIDTDVFPDGEYIITFSFVSAGQTYTLTKRMFNHDGLDRKILDKIDPSAGYYTQYQGSKEEHFAIDQLVKILFLREALLIDYSKGYTAEANLKLSIIHKYLRTCPVFKCNCAA